MAAVEEFYNVEAAAVHIEVDVPLFKIRRNRLPDGNLRMQPFHRAPCGILPLMAVWES